MSPTPGIHRFPFGEAGSLGARFASGEAAATDLFPSCASGAEDTVGSPALPTSCRTSRIQADAFGASSPEATDKLRSILDGAGALVATGQQPCLFLGPLFVLYKAVTAIELARLLERRLEQPMLALFWVASDDHDWQEVATTHLVDTENLLRSFRLEASPERRARSVGETRLDDQAGALLDEVRQSLPKSEFIDGYFTLFEKAYRPGRSIGEAFGEALAGLLEGRELVWLDSAAAPVKRALAPLLGRSIREAASAEAAVEGATARVREAGFEPQLVTPANASNVFFDDGRARRRVFVEGERARAGRDGEDRALTDLLSELERRPEAFGPSAALRPVAESCLLPVAASVLGPAEIGYWAQLPELFDWSGTGMPVTVPRTAWMVIEAKVEKVLDSFSVMPEELRDGGAALAERAVRAERPETVARSLADLEAAEEAAYVDLAGLLAEAMPGIRATAEKARAGARRARQRLERAVDAEVRTRLTVQRRQLEKAAVHLYPGGSPQERVMNPLYYLARYGADFLAQLDREVQAAVEGYVTGFGGAFLTGR